jgi:hypothetical protein
MRIMENTLSTALSMSDPNLFGDGTSRELWQQEKERFTKKTLRIKRKKMPAEVSGQASFPEPPPAFSDQQLNSEASLL